MKRRQVHIVNQQRSTRASVEHPRKENELKLSQELLVIGRNHQTGEVSLDPLRWGIARPGTRYSQNGTYRISLSCSVDDAWTTGVQRATSAARDRRNFSGVESRVGSIPVSISH
jgi:hypothetical protein